MEHDEDALASEYDTLWGDIDDTHREFVERFLSTVPAGGRVLDAACGTGKYFGMVLGSGRAVLGVDHSAGALAVAETKFPTVPTEKHDLQELTFRDEFDGVMCVDAMEMVPPEEWPVILEHFRRAARPGSPLYLTVERLPEEHLLALTAAARSSGHPVVEGEIVESDGCYHYYPTMAQVRTWLAEAGFAIEDDVEGPTEGDEDDEFAYHHVLARLRTRPG